jgi:hypothetical protein
MPSKPRNTQNTRNRCHDIHEFNLLHKPGRISHGDKIEILLARGWTKITFPPRDCRRFEVHHSGVDVLGKVNSRELELGASAMALMAYLLAQEGIG